MTTKRDSIIITPSSDEDKNKTQTFYKLSKELPHMSNTTQEQRQKEIDQAWAQHQKSTVPSKEQAWKLADRELAHCQRSSV